MSTETREDHYYTFAWPAMTNGQKAQLVKLAQAVLDVRAEFNTSALSDLYDPDVMPPKLRKAHQALDGAVDRLYRKAAYKSERERVEHLFGLHEKRTLPLAVKAKAPGRGKRTAQGK